MFPDARSLVYGLSSDNPSTQFASANKINKILLKCMPGIGPLDTEELIRYGVIPSLVSCLGVEDFPNLHYEAACGLTSIAGAKPDLLVAQDAGPKLVKLLDSDRDYVRQQAMWALCNLAGRPEHRHYLLNCGALMPLLNILYKDTDLLTLRFATLTLRYLCCGMPPPSFDEVKPALEKHLYSNDVDVLTHVCSAILSVCDGSEDGFQGVIEAGFVPKLVDVLQHPSPNVLGSVLLIIQTIARKDYHQAQLVINYGALPILSNLFTRNYDKNIRTAIFSTISSITAGFREHIESVIDENLVPKLVYLAQDTELDITNLVVGSISNVILGASPDKIKYLVEQGCIKPLCDLLVCSDLRYVSKCLDGLERILMAGEVDKNTGDVNSYCQLIEAAEGLEKIEKLQKHDNNEIYEKAVKILETYWFEEEHKGLVETPQPQGQGDDEQAQFQFDDLV